MGNTSILKTICAIYIWLICGNVFAQNYPYLNASSGCEGQYIVDADTNVFMYHGNQLEKYDKNFNPIWVRAYNISSFNNLLLSKTGSAYFTDASLGVFGKLDKEGNCEWAKTLDMTPNKLFLDRNNNLIISGIKNNNFYFLKSDTLGLLSRYRSFSIPGALQTNKFIIVNDSAGIYTFAWDATFFEWGGFGVLKYNDSGDSITNFYENFFPQFIQIRSSLYTTSQFEQGVFYSIIQYTDDNGPAQNHYFVISKNFNNHVFWSNQFEYTAYSDITINSFIEDGNKNILFTSSLDDDLISYGNSGAKIDSNGFANESFNLFHYSWWPPMQKTIKAKLHSLYGSKYFFDIYGDDFPQNPLTVSVLDSLHSNCATHGICSMTRSGSTYINGYYDNAQIDSLIYIPGDITITNSSVTDSIIHDYCTATNNLERISKNIFKITPNPVITELIINSYDNRQFIESTIFDINGQLILKSSSNNINLSELMPGMYFIKIKTDQSEFNQKFIKE